MSEGGQTPDKYKSLICICQKDISATYCLQFNNTKNPCLYLDKDLFVHYIIGYSIFCISHLQTYIRHKR